MTESAPPPSSEEVTAQANVELLELRSRVDALEQEAGSLRRFGVFALVVAALACGGAVSAHSRAGGSGARIERVEERLATHERESSQDEPRRFVPREEELRSDVRAERVSELEIRLNQLERQVSEAPRPRDASADVEAGLVAWGAETKRYVDEAVLRIGEEQRRLRGEEITRVWDRVLDIEARLDNR